MDTKSRIVHGVVGAILFILSSISHDFEIMRQNFHLLTGEAVYFYAVYYVILIMIGGGTTFLTPRITEPLILAAIGAGAPNILDALFKNQDILKAILNGINK